MNNEQQVEMQWHGSEGVHPAVGAFDALVQTLPGMDRKMATLVAGVTLIFVGFIVMMMVYGAVAHDRAMSQAHQNQVEMLEYQRQVLGGK